MHPLYTLRIGICAALPALGLQAQQTDTLRFRSAAFGTERNVVVHLPEFHRYTSNEVRMPVIILLDGQHDWFVEPVLNDIRFLQYTHEVPQAIVVAVPLEDRVKECAHGAAGTPELPLLRMLRDELPPLLAAYHPSDLHMLVGHSFSSSFALHAFTQAPAHFRAVIALSPAHRMRETLPEVMKELRVRKEARVLMALGGGERSKDGGHVELLAPVLEELDTTATGGRFLFRDYPAAGHTSLPIMAFPDLLATLFMPYALRDSLAPVNVEYKLFAPPPRAAELLKQVDAALPFLGSTLPWDIAEINGLASRLEGSGYTEQTLAVYRKGIELYPKYYEFHWWLGDLLYERDPKTAQLSLREALRLLDELERDLPDYREVRAEMEGMLE